LTLTGKPAVPAKSSGVTPRTRQPGEPDPREAPQDTPADAEPAPPPETAGEDLDPKPLGLPFGMLISGGATLLPSLGGWTPGYNGAIGYQFAIASFFTMGFTFGVDQDTSLIVEGEQTTRTLAEAGIYARLGLPLMADTWGVVPYLGAGIKGASPVAGGSNKGFVRFDATLGAMFTWSKWGAVGVELSPCFSLDARPVRLDGVPMRLFVIL
jgi:hypothetical protein